ncbi:MAG: DNA polymerase III subunit gamma/tau [Flavobacteriaceae bacterium]|nr:DNA polymerase III subunit gamma/tau [Flavobacteriaceae bacterium]
MEQFIVSARKYRPQVFSEVVGQQAITNTLENAIKNNHLAQALLFTGPRGVGKTTCARILAKKINEASVENPEDHDFAFNIFELDAASNNSVDDIRNLTEQVRIPPQVGKYKVYIIDEVHMLSQAAFNAFLKTLEEPPAHAIFILATTEKHKIIPTILSRCQIFDFKRIQVIDAKNYLKKIAIEEGINAEDDALHVIAQKADGAMRDALSIFDRVVSFSGKELTRQAVTENLNVLDYDVYFTSTNLILKNDIPNILLQFNSVLSKGFEGHHYINGLASHFRDLLVAKDAITIDLLDVGDVAKKRYLEQSQATSINFLLAAIEKANTCDLNYKSSKNQRLLVELCIMQLASITFDGEKKKGPNYIIPASFFKETLKGLAQKPVKTTAPATATATVKPLQQASNTPVPAKALGRRNRPTGLTLKSVFEKKAAIIEDDEENIDLSKLPKDVFNGEKLALVWKQYIHLLLKRGEKSIASIVNAGVPREHQQNIIVELPNTLMEQQMQRHRHLLLGFIRKQLNNFSLDLSIEVNETVAKRFAYTPQEKFKKLLEINDHMALLRNTFDLEL